MPILTKIVVVSIMSLNITENNDDKNRQENEIEVIKSIYNTFEFLIFPHKDKTFIQAQINMAINDSLILEYYENEGKVFLTFPNLLFFIHIFQLVK